MAAGAFEHDLPIVRGGGIGADTGGHLSQRVHRPIVHAVNRIGREQIEQSVLDHLIGTATALFGGLEDKHCPPVEIARFCQILRGPEQDRGVPVMAAGMHLARRFGRILKPRRLGDG